jgi:hypothetical protein
LIAASLTSSSKEIFRSSQEAQNSAKYPQVGFLVTDPELIVMAELVMVLKSTELAQLVFGANTPHHSHEKTGIRPLIVLPSIAR